MKPIRKTVFSLISAVGLILLTAIANAATPPNVLVVGQIAEPKSLDPHAVTAVNDFRILMNVCYDMMKKNAKMKKQDLEKAEPFITQSKPLKMELEEAMDRLPAQQKACFVLFAVEGIPQQEIGVMLELSLGGVKSNIHHAKNKLKHMLSVEYGENPS